MIALAVVLLVSSLFLSGCLQTENEETDKIPTEINMTSADLAVKVSPTNGTILSNVVTVRITKLPPITDKVLVLLVPTGLQSDNLYKEPNVIAQFSDKYSLEQKLDTTKVKNGEYALVVSVAPENAPDDSPWIASVQKYVTIKN